MSASHHGDRPDPAIAQRFMDQLNGTARREYPAGRMGATDDGALSYAVAADPAHGTVVVRFGKPVEWIGLGPADAIALAQSLIRKAREVSREPVRVEL
jgi:hypothetical protein